MEFGWDDELIEFRDRLRAFIREHRTTALAEEIRRGRRDGLARDAAGAGASEGATGPEASRFRDAMNRAGYTTMGWPVEYGGQGKGGLFAFLLNEELHYWDVPYVFNRLSIGSIGPTIMRFGTEQQKRDWLPKIITGEMTFALGYTEPNAGTDLANLQTRAVRDGDEWVINGQKMYGNFGTATHAWLAARTDPQQPRHRGVSVFVFPTNVPGISVRPMGTMARVVTSETFFEDVRIPVDSLFGDENRGWYYMANALDLERVMIAPYGIVQRLLEQLVEYIRGERPDLLDDPVVRTRVAEAELEVEINRALSTTNATMFHNGVTPTMEGAMAKVWSSDARHRLASLAMDLLGQAGGLKEAATGAPVLGRFEEEYRESPVHRFAGGTNDILRRVIATRGLGLPRG
jgi:alkylation response protein AidB-like acyl-CoA dehydrogenase